VLRPAYSTYSPISIKVNPQNLSSTIASIRKKYDEFFPGNLFDYYFLDEKFNEQYSNDQLFGKVFSLFAGFAIFIACLGLLGLSLFATAQRTKEIGVRKVLGASVSNILVLLSRDFIKLVLIASIIAFPVAWWVMHKWLQDFAYRINIRWWIFFGAGLLAIIIALGTISFQAIRAAIANPVKSLRTE
jgi:putative ABC transport system permease protein